MDRTLERTPARRRGDCFDRLRWWRSDRASRHVCEGIASTGCAGGAVTAHPGTSARGLLRRLRRLAMTDCFDRLRRWRSDEIASPPAAARNDRLLRPAAPVAQ
ncbi:hypothetical protein [Roseiflexus sp.]|uniref:hypothetical protein n=1 Tax=Roseiflexus sp. TaxID=2562120 RepID=UPI00258BD4BC|nr:hypothetical protein [Roseiflexus sp.]